MCILCKITFFIVITTTTITITQAKTNDHLFNYISWPTKWDVVNVKIPPINKIEKFTTQYTKFKFIKYCIVRDAIIWNGAINDKGSDAIHFIFRKLNHYTGIFLYFIFLFLFL